MHTSGYIAATLISLPLLLQGCAPIVVGGAAVGASVIHDRRPAGVVLEDQKTELAIRAAIGEDPELLKHSNVGVTSYNRVVLLTGQAESAQIRRRIHDIAAGRSGVSRVVDEVQVAGDATLLSKSQDAYLTSRVKLSLFELDLPDLDPTRIKVVTEREVVYLMGLVTQVEAAAVVKKVRFVPGVKRVVKVFDYIQPGA